MSPNSSGRALPRQQARASRVITQANSGTRTRAQGRERGDVTIIACMHVSLFIDEQLEPIGLSAPAWPFAAARQRQRVRRDLT